MRSRKKGIDDRIADIVPAWIGLITLNITIAFNSVTRLLDAFSEKTQMKHFEVREQLFTSNS